MNTAERSGKHISSAALALYARGDLIWPKQWKIKFHLRTCPGCRMQAEQFESAALELRREAQTETLTGFEAIADWNRLEREMLGNIAVGVAAARCIDHRGHRLAHLSGWAVLAGLVVLFIAGWATHIPREQTEHLVGSLSQWVGMPRVRAAPPFLRTTPAGIAVRAQGSTLTIINPPSAVVSAFGNSAVSARFVDEETGQVTITRVYAQ